MQVYAYVHTDLGSASGCLDLMSSAVGASAKGQLGPPAPASSHEAWQLAVQDSKACGRLAGALAIPQSYKPTCMRVNMYISIHSAYIHIERELGAYMFMCILFVDLLFYLFIYSSTYLLIATYEHLSM